MWNMGPIIGILLVFIVIPLLVGVIFWIVYRIKVNHHLKEDRDAMESGGYPPERRNHESGDPDAFIKGMLMVVLVVAAVIVMLVVTDKKIKKLDDSWREQLNQQSQQIRWLSNENRDLQRTLDEVLKEMKRQNSLVASFSVTPVKNSFDPADETNTFIIEITPKQADITTEVTLTIGDTTLTAERDGSVFRTEYKAPLFDTPDCDEIVASIRQNGVSTTEKIDPELFESVWLLEYEKIQSYLPVVRYNLANDVNCTKVAGTFCYGDTLYVTVSLPDLTDDSITSVDLTVTVNGTEKARHELVDQLTDGSEGTLSLTADVTGDVEAGGVNEYGVWEVCYTLKITDSLGYTYEYMLETLTFDGSNNEYPSSTLFEGITDDPRLNIVRRNAR